MQTSRFEIQLGTFVALISVAVTASAAAQSLQVVSLADPALHHAAGGNDDSGASVISADGRFVLFLSSASNLSLQDDASSYLDVFLRNRTNNTTTLVSVNRTGVGGGNGNSSAPVFSPDGRYVAFESDASNLVAGDSNGASDIFIRDLSAATTTLVSVNAAGSGPGNGASTGPALSADGRYVAFVSRASDLVAGDTNGAADIFLRDLQTGVTTRLSVASDGVTGGTGDSSYPVITPDGRAVAFVSNATNLVAGVTNFQGEVYVRDRASGTTTWAGTNSAALMLTVTNSARAITSFNPVISDDGSVVAFKAFGAAPLLLRHSLQSGVTDLVSSNALGYPFSGDADGPDMTPDGRFIAYSEATASAPAAVYLWDGQTGARTLVSANTSGAISAGAYSDVPAVSADGRFVAFMSDGTDLVPGATNGTYQVYLRDVVAGTTTLVSANTSGGTSGDTSAAIPTISADGRFVAFDSFDGGYVANDNNNATDVFVRDTVAGATELVSQAAAGVTSLTADGLSSLTDRPVSSDGRIIAFVSWANDLAPGDVGGFQDVYVRDVQAGTNILVSVDQDGTAGGNGSSFNPVLSDDGRHVVFISRASNLVANVTNYVQNIYLRDLQSGTTTLVSVSADGTTGAAADCSSPVISADARYVAFYSQSKNLVAGDASLGGEIFWRDTQAGTTVSATPGGRASAGLTMSADGRFLAASTAVSSPYTVFVWDSQSRSVIYSKPAGGDGVLSSDGRILVTLATTNYVLIARDLAAGTDRVIGYSAPPTFLRARISANGRFVAMVSPGDIPGIPLGTPNTNQVYLYDLQSDTTTLVSFNQDGTGPGNGPSDSPSISADGRYLTYRSAASDLVAGDNNGQTDIFVFDRMTGVSRMVSVNQAGSGPGNNLSGGPAISADGTTIVFRSVASDLVPGDLNDNEDVFLYRLAAVAVTDTDGDGMDDAWERAHFGDLSHNGSGDSDGDGLTDLMEYKAGTDPMDARSGLNAQATVSAPTGQCTLTWAAVPGRSYRVQYKVDLSQANWMDLPNGVGVSGPTATCVDDSTVVNNQRFYRVVLVE